MSWEAVGTAAGAVAAIATVLGALFFWAVKWLLDQHAKRMNDRLGELAASMDAYRTQQQKLERDLLELRAEIPEKYVRREDWIRFAAVIDAKLDTLRLALEQIREKVYERAGRA